MAQPGLTIIVQTRALDRVHYALMLAASSAALGAPTTVFFAIEGVHALIDDAWWRMTTAAGEPAETYLDRVEAAKAAHPDDLLEALGELGVRLAVCDSGLSVAGLRPVDLRDDIAVEVTGLTEIVAGAEAGSLVYV